MGHAGWADGGACERQERFLRQVMGADPICPLIGEGQRQQYVAPLLGALYRLNLSPCSQTPIHGACGSKKSCVRRPEPPSSTALLRHTASCPWAGPTRACATSCATVSMNSRSGTCSVMNRLKPIVRVRKRQTPARRRALSQVTVQPRSIRPCSSSISIAQVRASSRFIAGDSLPLGQPVTARATGLHRYRLRPFPSSTSGVCNPLPAGERPRSHTHAEPMSLAAMRTWGRPPGVVAAGGAPASVVARSPPPDEKTSSHATSPACGATASTAAATATPATAARRG